MAARLPTRRKDPIGERIAALSDQDLSRLVAELRLSTRLQQSTLASALREQTRRRRRAAGSTRP